MAKELEAEDIELKDYIFTPKEITVDGNSVIDYTDVENDKVFLCNRKDILDKPRPSWIPELDEKGLALDKFLPVCVKDFSDGNYFVQSKVDTGTRDANGKTVYKNKIYKMSSDVLAATVDYYLKRKRAELKREGSSEKVSLPRGMNSMPTKRYNEISKLCRLCNVPSLKYKDVDRTITDKAFEMKGKTPGKLYHIQNEVIFLEQWQPLLENIKGKRLDMNYQKQDYIDSYSKAVETAYGDKNTFNNLYNNYGVKIKKQNGSNFSKAEIDRLSETIEKVFKHYGNLSILASDYGLKVSYADNCMQFASKYIGLFSPFRNVIGVSFFNEEKQESVAGINHTADVTFSHEIAHWLDNQKGKESHSFFASDKYGTLENQIAEKFKNEIKLRKKSNKSAAKIGKTDEIHLGEYWFRTCECFARAMEQYYALQQGIDLSEEISYARKDNFETDFIPLIEQLMEENKKLFSLSIVNKQNIIEKKQELNDVETSSNSFVLDVYIANNEKLFLLIQDKLEKEGLKRWSSGYYDSENHIINGSISEYLKHNPLYVIPDNNSFIVASKNYLDSKYKDFELNYLNENLELEFKNEQSGLSAKSYYNSKNTRKLCHIIKEADRNSEEYKNAIEQMADYFVNQGIFNENSILVPAPQHTGKAEYTWHLAAAISQKTNSPIADILRCKPHETLYEQKKNGIEPDVEFYLENAKGVKDLKNLFDETTMEFWKRNGDKVYLLDNNISTGLTFNKSEKLLPGLIPAPYAIGNFAEITFKEGRYTVNNLLEEKASNLEINIKDKGMDNNINIPGTDLSVLESVGFNEVSDIKEIKNILKTCSKLKTEIKDFYKDINSENCRIYRFDGNVPQSEWRSEVDGTPLYVINYNGTWNAVQDKTALEPGKTFYHVESFPGIGGLIIHFGEKTNLSHEEATHKELWVKCPNNNIKITPEKILELGILSEKDKDFYRTGTFDRFFYQKLKSAILENDKTETVEIESENKNERIFTIIDSIFSAVDRADFLSSLEHYVNGEKKGRDIYKIKETLNKEDIKPVRFIFEGYGYLGNSIYESFVCKNNDNSGYRYLMIPHNADFYKGFDKLVISENTFSDIDECQKALIDTLVNLKENHSYKIETETFKFYKIPEKFKQPLLTYIAENEKEICKKTEEWFDAHPDFEKHENIKDNISVYLIREPEAVNFNSPQWLKIFEKIELSINNPLLADTIEVNKQKENKLMEETKEIKEMTQAEKDSKILLETYGNKKAVDAACKKASVSDFVSTDKTRYFMTGIFYEKGFAIATDGRMLIKLKKDYPAAWEGKIIDPNTLKEIEGTFPAYEKVFPNKDRLIDRTSRLAHISNYLSEATAAIAISEKTKRNERIVPVMFENTFVNPRKLQLALSFARDKGFNKVFQEDNYKIAPVPVLDENGKEVIEYEKNPEIPLSRTIEFDAPDGSSVLIMPMREPEGAYIDKDGILKNYEDDIFIKTKLLGKDDELCKNIIKTLIKDTVFTDSDVDSIYKKNLDEVFENSSVAKDGLYIEPSFLYEKEKELFVDLKSKSIINSENIKLNNITKDENGFNTADLFVPDATYIKQAAINEERFAMPVATWKDNDPNINIHIVKRLISSPHDKENEFLDFAGNDNQSIASEEKWNLMREQKSFDIIGEQIEEYNKNLSEKSVNEIKTIEIKPVTLEEILDVMDMRPDYTANGNFMIYDTQRQEYISSWVGMEDDNGAAVFSNASEAFERLDIYINDYYFNDMQEQLEACGIEIKGNETLSDLCKLYKTELEKGNNKLSSGELNLAMGIVEPDTVLFEHKIAKEMIKENTIQAGETVSLSIKQLYETLAEKNGTFFFNEKSCVSLSDGKTVEFDDNQVDSEYTHYDELSYYDLYDKYGKLLCCDGETVTFEGEAQSGNLIFKNDNQKEHFTLSKEEFEIASKTFSIEMNQDIKIDDEKEIRPEFLIFNKVDDEKILELKEHLKINGYDVKWQDKDENNSFARFTCDIEEKAYIQTILEDRGIDYEYTLGLLASGYDAAWLNEDEQFDAEIVSEEEFKRINEIKEKEYKDLKLPYIKIDFTESSGSKHKLARMEAGTVLGLKEGEELLTELNNRFNTFLKADVTVHFPDAGDNEPGSYSLRYDFTDDVRHLDDGKEIPFEREGLSDYIRMTCSYPEVLEKYEQQWQKVNASNITEEQKKLVADIIKPNYEKLKESYKQHCETLKSVIENDKKIHSSWIVNKEVSDASKSSLETEKDAIAVSFERYAGRCINSIADYLDENKDLSFKNEFINYAEHQISNMLQDVKYGESRNAKYGEHGYDFDFTLWRHSLEKVMDASEYKSFLTERLQIEEKRYKEIRNAAKDMCMAKDETYVLSNEEWRACDELAEKAKMDWWFEEYGSDGEIHKNVSKQDLDDLSTAFDGELRISKENENVVRKLLNDKEISFNEMYLLSSEEANAKAENLYGFRFEYNEEEKVVDVFNNNTNAWLGITDESGFNYAGDISPDDIDAERYHIPDEVFKNVTDLASQFFHECVSQIIKDGVEYNTLPGTSLSNFDHDKFREIYSESYNRYYNAEDKETHAEQSENMRRFDFLMKYNKNFKEAVQVLVSERKDPYSSDRECAAVVDSLRKLGIDLTLSTMELADVICQEGYEQSASGFMTSFSFSEIAELADRNEDWVRDNLKEICEALATHNDELLLDFNETEALSEPGELTLNFCSVGEYYNELFKKGEDGRWIRKTDEELRQENLIEDEIDKGIESIQTNSGMSDAAIEADYEAQIKEQEAEIENDIDEKPVWIINGEPFTEKIIEEALHNDLAELFEQYDSGETEKNLTLVGVKMYRDSAKDGKISLLVEFDSKNPENRWHEDSLFNALNEEGIEFNAMKVDFNPITKEKSGTIEQYLKQLEGFGNEEEVIKENARKLEEKEIENKLNDISNSLSEIDSDEQRILPFSIFENKEKGRVNIKFDTAKINRDILKELNAHGWKYAASTKQWYPVGNAVKTASDFANRLQEKYSETRNSNMEKPMDLGLEQSPYDGIRFFDRNYNESEDFAKFFNSNIHLFKKGKESAITEEDAATILKAIGYEKDGIVEQRKLRVGLDNKDKIVILTSENGNVKTEKIELSDILEFAKNKAEERVIESKQMLQNFLGKEPVVKKDLQDIFISLYETCVTQSEEIDSKMKLLYDSFIGKKHEQVKEAVLYQRNSYRGWEISTDKDFKKSVYCRPFEQTDRSGYILMAGKEGKDGFWQEKFVREILKSNNWSERDALIETLTTLASDKETCTSLGIKEPQSLNGFFSSLDKIIHVENDTDIKNELMKSLLGPYEAHKVSKESTKELSVGDKLGEDTVSDLFWISDGVCQATLSREVNGVGSAQNYFVIDNSIINQLDEELKELVVSFDSKSVIENKSYEPYILKELIEKGLMPPRDDEFIQQLDEYISVHPLKYEKLKPVDYLNFERKLQEIAEVDKAFNKTPFELGQQLIALVDESDRERLNIWLRKQGCDSREHMAEVFASWLKEEPEQKKDVNRKKENGYPPRGEQ